MEVQHGTNDLPYEKERKAILFKDLFAHREDLGIDHNGPGIAGFPFYLGASDFDHILPHLVLTPVGQEMLSEGSVGGQLSMGARGRADFPCKRLQSSGANSSGHHLPCRIWKGRRGRVSPPGLASDTARPANDARRKNLGSF